MRLKLWPAIGQPQLFFLAEDDGVAYLFERLQQYHWKRDAAENILEEPEKEDDDECDAIRYMVMNVFAPKGKVTVTKAEERNALAVPTPKMHEAQVKQHHWEQLMRHSGMGVEDGKAIGEDDPGLPKAKGKKGSFVWDLG
jgi:hypothetical protein